MIGFLVITSDDVNDAVGEWGAMEDGDEDGNKADQRQLERAQQVKVEDVIVASCSDDGTVQVWRPLEVGNLSKFIVNL